VSRFVAPASTTAATAGAERSNAVRWLDPRGRSDAHVIDSIWSDWGADDLFHDPRWFWPSLDLVSPPADGLRFALIGSPRDPVALIPVEYRRLWPHRPLPKTFGFFAKRGTLPDAAMFVRPKDAREAARALVGLLQREGGAQLDLTGLTVDGPMHRALLESVGGRRVAIPRPVDVRYYVATTDGAEAYAAARTQKHRQNLRRSWRQLAAWGEPALEISTVERAEAFAVVEALDARSWRLMETGRKAPAVATTTAVNNVCRRLIADFGEDTHRITRLRVGEVDVASCYMQIRGAVAYAWKINFDEAYGRASPGTVVFHEAIMDALRSGVTRVEFMAATFQTARAATHSHRTARDVLALPTWRGDVMNAVLRLSTRRSARQHRRAASTSSPGEA
jgi:hypothetical protein